MNTNKIMSLILSVTCSLILVGCGSNSTTKSEQTPSTALAQQSQKRTEDRYADAFKGSETPPPFEAYLNGKKVGPEILKGKTTVIAMGSTWCPDCQLEMDILNKLKKEYADQEDVQILMLFLVDSVRETEESIQEYIHENKLDFLPYMVDNKTGREVYKISFIPTTMVIRPDGKAQLLKKDAKGNDWYYLIESGTEEELKAGIEEARKHKSEEK